jgi:hypothetical protein
MRVRVTAQVTHIYLVDLDAENEDAGRDKVEMMLESEIVKVGHLSTLDTKIIGSCELRTETTTRTREVPR